MSEQNVQVTQADREAAAELIEAYWQGGGREHERMRKLAKSYRDGHTQGVWAAAFARHRTRAEPDLVEAARDAVTDAEEFGILDGLGEDGRPIATLAMRAEPIRRLRAALTRLAGEPA